VVDIDDRWLIARLRDLAIKEPDRQLYLELADGENETGRLTAAELAARAAEVAARLADAGARPGDRAIVFDGRIIETLAGYLGSLAAGVAPIVLPPPRRADHIQSRLLPVVHDARPVALLAGTVATDADQAVLDQLAGHIPQTVQLGDVAGTGDVDALTDEALHPLAFIQYTSGSTAAPRGVMVGHAQLQDNLEKACRVFDWQADGTTIVTWNPLSHDMGLIVGALPAVAFGTSVVIMPPEAFILRPGRWLRAITRYAGTHGAGPNFAYDLCIDRVKEADREGLDLSSWRAAINGAEAVREGTRQRFLDAYVPRGFRPDAWCPGYGLAESTVMVCASRPMQPPKTTWIERSAQAEGRVVEVPAHTEGANAVVGCGTTIDGLELAIVDPESGQRLGENEIGELWLRGPSVTTGYFERPDETAELFGGTLADGDGPWLRTGDVGFVSGGEIHPVGRAKDVLIVRGRNMHASDVELAAAGAHPAIRKGCIIAFATDTGEKEQIVVVAEVNGNPDHREVSKAVREHVFTALEVAVDDVFLTTPRSVPKTTSGKLQRSECRRLYNAGALPVPQDEPVST